MIYAGIVAGGSGSRMGTDVPKQFRELCGRPLIEYSAEAFLAHPSCDCVIIAVPAGRTDWVKSLFPVAHVIEGGDSRMKTVETLVREARRLGAADSDIMITHDAARPFVTEAMITESIEAAMAYGAATVAVPVSDTVACSADGIVIAQVPPRDGMYSVQTPQSFKTTLFESALTRLTESEVEAATDISGLLTAAGYSVRLVCGDRSNIKLTYPEDWRVAEEMLGFI